MPPSASLPRERYLILAVLLLLTIVAWAVLAWQRAAMDTTMPMGPTMGLTAPLFLTVWITMMVAMMFPTAAPMILMYAQVHASRQQHGQSFVPTWVFVAAYLVVWTLFGVVAYAGALGAEKLAGQLDWLMVNGARLGGVVLLAAGLYQLSPLKRRCLSTCRSPLQFLLTSWHGGYRGAFRMGLEHGTYCLGCCWLLFIILFPLGVMNLAAMASLTLVVFAEKALPGGRQIGQIVAVALIAYGTLVAIVPAALPTL